MVDKHGALATAGIGCSLSRGKYTSNIRCNKCVLCQYLADQGFNSTLKLFKEECQKRGRELSLPADNGWSDKQDRKLNIQVKYKDRFI